MVTVNTFKVKRCIVGFHFRGSLFCVDFVSLYWTFWSLGTPNIFGAMAFTFRGSFPKPVLVSLSSNSRYTCPMEVLTKFYVSPWTHFCVPCSLVTLNGLCCWTIPCLKALLPWNFPRDPFQTELEHLLHLKQRKHSACCPYLSLLDPFALTGALSEFPRTGRLS